MEKLAEVCRASDGLLMATTYRQVDVTDADSVDEATRWWEELKSYGGEGMVLKPFDAIVRGRRGLVQPAVKCRGREYLRPAITCESRAGAIHPENRQCRFEGSAPRTHFAAHNSPIRSQKSAIASSHPFFLSLRIGGPLLEIELTRSQQTRKLFLTGGFFAGSAPAAHINYRRRGFLTATDPNSENWQSHENTRETIF